jgi:putative hydrolase of the HAD superfamily
MIDAVLFDLGDTIIDFGVGRREAELLFRQGARLTYRDLTTRQQPNLPTFDRYFKVHYRIMQRAYLWSKISRRDFSYDSVLSRAAGKLGLKLSHEDLHRLAHLWYQPINLASDIDAGVGPMLQQLQAAGTRLGLVSNTLVPGHCLDKHLEEEGILHFFPTRIYSSHVRYRKPHPRIFEIALEKIGIPASRTLFIGDLLKADISGAKKMGMHTIWKPARNAWRNGHLPTPRRHHADAIIHKVTHLPEALLKFGWRPTHRIAPQSPQVSI